MNLHRGTLLAGVVFIIIGVVFFLEALGVWTIRLVDLRLIGPLVLVVIGVAIIIGTVGRDRRP